MNKSANSWPHKDCLLEHDSTEVKVKIRMPAANHTGVGFPTRDTCLIPRHEIRNPLSFPAVKGRWPSLPFKTVALVP